VEEIWALASQPTFIAYSCCVLLCSLVLIYRYAPRYGKTEVWVYVLICSLVGSLSVVALRALGIAIKLTYRGSNQLHKKETYFLVLWVGGCIATQMNYLNKALDTFNTTMVSSVYYVFFTVCTVTASIIMYKDWENQTASSIFWQMFALSILVLGVHILSATKDSPPGCATGLRVLMGRAVERKEGYTLCAGAASEDDDAEMPSPSAAAHKKSSSS